MASLKIKKVELKELHLDVFEEPVYFKPLKMSMLNWADKLAQKDLPPIEQAVAMAKIIQGVMVDKDGNSFDNIKEMTADEIVELFSVEDFTKIIEIVMPAPKKEGEDGLGN